MTVFYKIFLFVALLLLTNRCNAQWSNISDSNIFSLGLTASLGTHQQSLGCFLRNDFSVNGFVNRTQLSTSFNLKTLGPSLSYAETRLSSSMFYQFGEQLDSEQIPNLNVAYFKQEDALGYELAFIFNKIGTRQSVGAIIFKIKSIHFIFQNDLLGNTKGKDRFRTGSFALGFQTEQSSLWLKSLLWTGETRCPGKALVKTEDYPSRFGYKDISSCPFSECSHGVLSLHGTYQNSIANEMNIAFGVDSEQVRHFLQNRLIHDMFFLPAAIVKSENPHIPMLDANGQAYLFEKDQRIRPTRLFFNLAYNGQLLY